MGKDMDYLISGLIDKGIPADSKTLKAMRAIDRRDFVLEKSRYSAYSDIPLPIGYGQTISQPFTVAFMLELLDVKRGNQVLDIGSGSGWTTALLAYLTDTLGAVVGTEIIPELVDFGKRNISKYNFKNARIIRAGERLGVPEMRFDRILVSAAGDDLDDDILSQLDIGGILVIPIRNSIWKIIKLKENTYDKREYAGFVFVPLIVSDIT